jgi:hypothetical protein
MAWSRKKVNSADLNRDNEYTKDSVLSADALNSIVNSGLYSQDFVEHLADNPDVSDANNVGIPSVTLVDSPSATVEKPYKRLKFSNLKGERGEKGDKGETGSAGKDGAGCYINGVATDVNFTSDPQAQINNLGTNINNLWKTLYPVNSIYFSRENNSPANFLGGTWEVLLSNATIVLSGNARVEGDGNVLGITTNSYLAGLMYDASSGKLALNQNIYGQPMGANIPNISTAGGWMTVGITKDGSNSGLIADLSTSNTLTGIYAWRRVS